MKAVAFLICLTLLLSTCKQHGAESATHPNDVQTHDSVKPNGSDSGTVSKEFITKAYCQAIAAFIQAVHEKHNTCFDTLYFGKHVYGQADDFPDIELPKTIKNTEIRLIKPEAGASLQKERKSLVYINLMGWLDPKKAEFIFVTFSNGGVHQYDCYITYKARAGSPLFEMENLRFDYFLYQGKH